MRPVRKRKSIIPIALFAASLVFVSYGTITLINKTIPSNSTTSKVTAASKTSDQWGGLLNQCPKSDHLLAIMMDKIINCISDVWVKAWDKQMMNDFNNSLRIFIEQNPNLNNYCHRSGHQAGYVSYRENLISTDLLKSVVIADNTCNNGFLHGLFDGFANKAKSQDEFKLLVETCMSLKYIQHSVCTDGTGHAAFQYTHDPLKALDMCIEYKNLESRHGCGLGVFMQMYRPDTDNNFEPYLAYKSLKIEWPDMCNKIEKNDSYISFRKGCKEVFGYLLAQDIGTIILSWATQYEEGKTSSENDNETSNSLKTHFSSCSLLENKYDAETCKHTFAQNLVWQTSANHKAQMFLCKQLDPRFYADCSNSQIPAFENTSQAK